MILRTFIFLLSLLPVQHYFAQNVKFMSDSNMYNSAFVSDLKFMMPGASIEFNGAQINVTEGKTIHTIDFPVFFSFDKKTWVNGTKGNIYVGLRLLQANYTDILVDIKIKNNGMESLEKEIRATINTAFVLANSHVEDDQGNLYPAYLYTATLENGETIFITIGKCSDNNFCIRMERIGSEQEFKNISFDMSPLLKTVVTQ